MRRFGASNASRCARPGDVIAPMVIATTRSAIPKMHQARVALRAAAAPCPNIIDTMMAAGRVVTPQFPAGSRIGGGIFLVLWADGWLPWQFADRPEPPRANATGSRRQALRCFPTATGRW